MTREICTLCLLVEGNEILLGMKKVGFGIGKYNGFGGKVHAGEEIETAAIREMKEESGLEVSILEKAGILLFYWPDRVPARSLEVHVYTVGTYSGHIRETEEMRPQWFALDEIPYEGMWPDDRSWLPLLLEGKKFRGTFHFGAKEDIIYEKLSVVPSL